MPFGRWGEGIQLRGTCPRWQSTPSGLELQMALSRHVPASLRAELDSEERRRLKHTQISPMTLRSQMAMLFLNTSRRPPTTNVFPVQRQLDFSDRDSKKCFSKSRDKTLSSERRVNPGAQRCSIVFISFPSYRLNYLSIWLGI